VWRIGELAKVIGDYSLDDIGDGWAEFIRVRCAGLAPATIDRFRATLVAALRYAGASDILDYDPPTISPIKFTNERIRWLGATEAETLHRAYVAHVQPIVTLFRFQGCRTQEALQLDWANVSFGNKRTVYFERTKNTQPRTVAMHERSYADLLAIWEGRGRPTSGTVFLNRLGQPFADTRNYKYPGGNPLRRAHGTAFWKARVRPNGGPDFTVHDWRHHWASHMIMSGADMQTLMKLGGWKDLRSVMRYAAVSTEHMAQAIDKYAESGH
jgi:integrase